ncbi:DNA-directed RNA polymerase subunit beta [Kroppenstedtia eburnea]|uniref:DNA-directed RNA polymerase subunit beta n=1 Tax=Kroppenstedtia eburnea TaxID=714067 RepID=A0A1N7JP64_9BACL|nr:DNA-directed RNA polymerase subunit beta [Kroppenstedtia eburnea]EGK10703.1 hypothetical protein HMPREF9374_2363 [Desmospora sp. 8437]QKI83491.1 DNA-directed RNA polymerase subunit beta [Kroppenstedtia eburnea]SIS51051.1 DNA-directed RNA polymerase subunit beta [Kroppenstedtia eburnea]
MQQKEEKPTQVWAKNTESNSEEAQAGASKEEKAATDEQLTKPTVSPAPPEQHAEEKAGSPPKPIEEETGASGEVPPKPETQDFQSDGIKTGDHRSTTDWEDQLDRDWGVGASPSPSHPGPEDGKSEEDPGVTTKASARPEEHPKPAGVLKWKKGDSGEDVKTDPEPEGEPAEEEIPRGETGSPSDDRDREEAPEQGERKSLTKKVLLFTFIWFPLLLVAALAGGLLIGYSVIGDDPAGDVFTRDLWEHLYNLIYG